MSCDCHCLGFGQGPGLDMGEGRNTRIYECLELIKFPCQ
jgi:hypothetical protein